MLNATIQIIAAVLDADKTISKSDRDVFMAVLKNGAVAQPDGIPRFIRRSEVAKRLSCSLRLVDRMASSGALPKRKLPGRVRSSGFLESDVNKFIASSKS